jgi:lipid A 3-O-deacylase
MRKILAAAILLLVVSAPARAVDSLSGEFGLGSHDVMLWRVGAQWDQHPQWLEDTRWHLYWDFAVGSWSGNRGTVHDVGLTPVFRYARAEHGLFYEGAIGFHVLSDSHISTDLGFSTRFQFGDHLGVGYRFDGYDVLAQLQHLSNGGMRNPNPGINFLVLRVQYRLP